MQVRHEVQTLLDTFPKSLKASDFDAGIIAYLQRSPESTTAASLRHIGRRLDLASASNKPAFLMHWLQKLATPEERNGSVSNNGALPAVCATT